MRSIAKFWDVVEKYHVEFLKAAASAIAGYIATVVLDPVLPSPGINQVEVAIAVTILVFLVVHAFDVRRNITYRLSYIESDVGRLVGRRRRRQYDERKAHYAAEKELLANDLIIRSLPALVNKLENAKRSGLAIVIDSGTTLESLFPKLKLQGFRNTLSASELNGLQLFTNSLSGSDVFCTEVDSYLKEAQLTLFGGTPIEKYRAVIGPSTTKAVEDLAIQCEESKRASIGIITANWCLVGTAYDQLVICSSEHHHLEFKRAIARFVDHLYVVAPLGKLLRANEVGDLNHALRRNSDDAPYEGFDVSKCRAENEKSPPTVVTTFRESHDSILYLHSKNLRTPHRRSFELIDTAYDPPGSSEQQFNVEVPHRYMRAHAENLLQISRAND